MKQPRATLPRRSDRDERAYYYTKATGGVDRAMRVSTEEYKYIDIYNDDDISRQQALVDKVVCVYNSAKVSCDVGFSNGSSISIFDGATFSVSKSFVNHGVIKVLKSGTLSILSSFDNLGSITVESGGTLEIFGELTDHGSLVIEDGAVVRFVNGTLNLANAGVRGPGYVLDSPHVFVNVSLFLELENASQEAITGAGCSVAESSLSAPEGYSLGLYKEISLPIGSSIDDYASRISPIGFSLMEVIPSGTIAVDSPREIACARFSKKSIDVTVRELLVDDYASGPVSGKPVVTVVPVKYYDKFSEALFPMPTRPGYSLRERRLEYLTSKPVASIYGFPVTHAESVYLLYSPIEYSVTYVLNGGSGAVKASYTTLAGLTLQAPTKPGCSFSGWYLDPGLSSRKDSIAPGEIGDVTLFAKFDTN